jgi:23S rRNA (cytosine1962-C5)-methyltransferase
MTEYGIVTLKSGREDSAYFHHPWIFSGAIEKTDDNVRHGSLVYVAGRDGAVLATGTYSAQSSIAVRVFEFRKVHIDQAWFVAKIKTAHESRELCGYGADTETTGYRVVFGESDGLPGLVIDRFGSALVFQISTAGMDALRIELIAALTELFKPSVIVERSDIAIRKEEGLEEVSGVVSGELPREVSFKENGLTFAADILTGQKTGFFLDQKDTRAEIKRLASDKNILNVFSYTGAAGVAALAGGAKSVLNIDGSQPALDGAMRNAELNECDANNFAIEQADAFSFLSAPSDTRYDMVIIDPPALIKSRRDSEEGKRAYHFLNRAALRKVAPGGIFVTSSCSHFLSEEDFVYLLRRASLQNKVRLEIIKVIYQSSDHPRSLYFPESLYLKTFICRVVPLVV